jgi:5'-3' exonuclease
MEIKTALIIDGNFILNRNSWALNNDNLLYGYLHRSLQESIDMYINYYNWDKIYLVSDTKHSSWRKEIYPEYKATREKSSEMDWEFIYIAYDEFKADIKQNRKNIEILEADRIEGDDWISHIVKTKNNQNYSFLIVASDNDLKQLINLSLNPLYINIMTNGFINKEKVSVPKNYEVFLNELKNHISGDLFNLNNNGEFINFIQNFLEKRLSIEINPIESLFIKMISGDKSDNIDSVFKTETKTGKLMGIGEKGAENIYNKYVEEFGEPNLEDDEIYENIADLICEAKKVSSSNMEIIEKNLKLNRNLVDFNKIPQNIIEIMNTVL